MASEAVSNATWKAVSTLEWKKKQKKPASASKGVGAILGEAADVVVGKYANSSGPNSSPYLNRLSEIQIQDEAYIHQQLVIPEEVKPKRPAHRIFLGKGSRSSRGLKLSTSRKVRFNEGGEGSPTHKTAAAAAPGRASGAGIAVVAQAVPHATNAATAAGGAAANSERHARFARSSSSDGGTSPPAASTAGAGGAAKAGRRAAGVSFEPLPSSSTASSRTPDNASGAPGSTVVKQQGADTTPSGAAAGHAGATGSSTAAGASQALPALSPAAAAAVQAAKQSLPLSAQRSPSPLQQRPPGLHLQQQQRQQQQHAQGGSSPSGASSVQHGGVGDSALMTRFLQQQPYGLDSPGNNGGSSLDLYGLQAGRQGSASALEKRTARRSTDLVDKQLQWLKDGTDSATSSSSSGSSSAGPSAAAAVPSGVGGPLADFAATLGYRPTAIPQELFDRWSNIGGPKPPPAAAAPTATPAASRPATAGGNAPSASSSGGGSGSGSGTKHAPRRHSTSCEVPTSSTRLGVGVGVGMTVGSSLNSSRPSSGHEAVAARLPPRRVSATNVLEGRVPLEYPKHGLNAGLRTSSADMSTLHALVAAVKPPASSGSSSSGGPARATSAIPHSSLASTRSLPRSGRASPAHDPASPRSHSGANGSSSGSSGLLGGSSGQQQQQQPRRSSCGLEQSHGDASSALTANATTGRGARAAAALAAAAISAGSLSGGSSSGSPSRRASRATGSTSSSHGDEGDRLELHAGGRSPLQGGMLSMGTAGMHGVGGSHVGSAGGAGSTQAGLASAAAAGSLGIRHGSATGSSTSGSKAHLPDIGAKGAAGQQRH